LNGQKKNPPSVSCFQRQCIGKSPSSRARWTEQRWKRLDGKHWKRLGQHVKRSLQEPTIANTDLFLQVNTRKMLNNKILISRKGIMILEMPTLGMAQNKLGTHALEEKDYHGKEKSWYISKVDYC
jgi:hypothetical protein